jgi:HK97 family phage major capsid protein
MSAARTRHHRPLSILPSGAKNVVLGYRKDGRPIHPIAGGADTMLLKLEDQYRGRLSLITAITEEAAKRDGGLSEQDRATIKSAQEEARSLQADIELLSERIELNESTRERLRTHGAGGADLVPGAITTRGELVHVKMRAAGGDRDALHRYETFMRAAQHMGTSAAATTPTAGGMAGLLIPQNVGPVIDVSPRGRPLAAALGIIPSADPMAFRRPVIDDPDWDDGMGVQTLEKAELPSRAFDVTAQDVTLKTIGGYLNISQQLLAMPIGALDLTLNRLEARYARVSELRVLAAITTGADLTTTLAADAGGAAFLAALYAASARVYAATGQLAEWVAMGPTGYARVGSFVDLADRPLFPSGAAVNAMGAASAASFQIAGLAGLSSIVTPAITTGDFFVGNSLGIEAYEYRFPVFDSVEPSVLGRQVAVSGAFGTFRPVAGGVARIAPGA